MRQAIGIGLIGLIGLAPLAGCGGGGSGSGATVPAATATPPPGGGGGPQTPPAAGPIPARAAGALTGSQFLQATDAMTRDDREALALQEILAGNIPDYLRTFRPITFIGQAGDGQSYEVTLFVMPDVLGIGSDQDFIRMPLWSPTGQTIADAFACTLPTRRMVDLIYTHAQTKVAPVPLTPTAQMMSNAYFLTHHQAIEQQVAGISRALLLAGHKKDVVISNKLLTSPDKVAIYGWHQLNGQPIQPLSTVHIKSYADYSHGIRLVKDEAIVGGVALSVAGILQDPVFHALLSDEGVMPSPWIP